MPGRAPDSDGHAAQHGKDAESEEIATRLPGVDLHAMRQDLAVAVDGPAAERSSDARVFARMRGTADTVGWTVGQL
jgi:hypothetical protein